MAMGFDRVFAGETLSASFRMFGVLHSQQGATAPVGAKGPNSPVDIWARMKGAGV